MQSSVPPNTAGPLPIAVLISGDGGTMAHLARQTAQGRLDAEIRAVIASKPEAGGLPRAQRAGLAAESVPRRDCVDVDAFSEAVFERVRAAGARLVCLAGFLSLLRIPEDYTHRVINLHPALLPSFGGQGMHGRYVHEAVLAAGCKVSGCTVHFADQQYDSGPILVQRCCRVAEDDTAHTLARRVRRQERIAYPQAIQLLAEDRAQIDEHGRARVLPRA
jgi:formyltetrahydrofolate-dependent phosphoribosylglycinamide formyltransferase